MRELKGFSSRIILVFVLGITSVLSGAGAGWASPAQTQVVSPEVSRDTPDVNDGTVYAIAKIGHRVYLGGDFTNATSRGSTVPTARPFILAFDDRNGRIDTAFLPTLDGSVSEMEPGPNNTLYLTGNFKTVNGQTMRVARVDAITGALISGWNPTFLNGVTNTIELFGNTLFVGGQFTVAGGSATGGLVALSAQTGMIQPWFSLNLAGIHGQGAATGSTGAKRIDLTPDGRSMVVIGNFTSATDQLGTESRDQVMLLTLDQQISARVNRNWNSLAFTGQCANVRFSSTVRDVELSPDGSYFVIASTAANGTNVDGTKGTCDSAVRFETAGTGTNIRPTWSAYTGQDSLWSVAVTGAAVYVGGHQKWFNNDNASGVAGPGAVPRPGVAALDPLTGLPMNWNPGRHPRGGGVFALLATDTGLYLGSDTEWTGYFQTRRKRVAFFPIATGTTPPAGLTGQLPGRVFLAGSTADVVNNAKRSILHRVNAGGPEIQATDGGPNWSADSSTSSSPMINQGNMFQTWSEELPVDSTVPARTPSQIFDTERWDEPGGNEMEWSMPVPAGTRVRVRLYFADRYNLTTQPGQRVFHVDVDGVRKLSNMDVAVTVGSRKGTMKTIDITSDGLVNLRFIHQNQNPLINGIELLQLAPQAAPALVSRTLDTANAVGPLVTVDSASLDWSTVRGMFLVDNTVFYGRTDGTFHRRTLTGNVLGSDQIIDPYNDPYWSPKLSGSRNGSTYRGMVPGIYGQFSNVTSAFYEKGRLYYTLLGQPGMQWRAFNPESGIIGALAFPVVDGRNWASISGATVANERLYYASSTDGFLRSVSWVGRQATGADTLVNATADWRSNGLFVRTGAL